MDGTLGEVRLFAGNFAPKGWEFCHGQLIGTGQNQALFSLLGATYGGDGRESFALPDLRGRVPVGVGEGPELSEVPWGAKFGQETITVDGVDIQSHTHSEAEDVTESYTNAAMGGTTYETQPPSLGLNYLICVVGYYPSRD